MPPNTVWTIGHSNRELNDFLALLAAEKIESLADVRRFPGSRRHPHFNRDALSATLHNLGITYTHFPALGGRRKRATKSPLPSRERPGEGSNFLPLPLGEGRGEGALSRPQINSPWRVAAFAAYADYMLTEDFKAAFQELQTLATHSRTAIMCAEALPWRCHRRLIADQFIAQDWTVLDIIGPHNTKPHELPAFAKIVKKAR
jgi:uncharacterized protein (DUF488 family)